MFSKVVIGVDGREGGRDAIALAKQLGPDADMILAHAYGAGLMPGRGAAMLLGAEREDAERLLKHERKAAGLAADLVPIAEHAVGRALHELADTVGADLLVVGSSRRALLGRIMIGDDTRASLNGAPCAVAIAPRGYAQAAHPLLTLGVGYDGSPESVGALAVARELAARNRAKIKALWVVSLPQVEEDAPIPADWPQAIDKLVEECSQRLTDLGGVEARAIYGGPREELARFGDEVDLLIVGSRGYGPTGRLLHGTVSGYLLGHAHCPLLVLPRGARRHDEPRPTEQHAQAVAGRS
jgi:nucleotide-binding universal stress UspA family protein